MRPQIILSALVACVLFACSSSDSPTISEVEQANSTFTPQPTATVLPTKEAPSTPEPSPEVMTPSVTPTLTVSPQAPEATHTLGIEIIGSGQFVSQTEQDLEFLLSCAPDAMLAVDKFIDVIQESERSGMRVGEGVFLASETTAFAPGYSKPAQHF